MIVNGAARLADRQTYLWEPDKPFISMAQTRNWSGDFFEEATGRLVAGVRLKTHGGAEVCPDVRVGDNVFVESKGAGKNGAVIVYDARMAKDIHWTAERGASLFYCIWHHNADCITDKPSMRELRRKLAISVRYVLLIPLADLAARCVPEKKRVINSKPARKGQGFGGRGYRDGWSMRLADFRAGCGEPCEVGGVEAYGVGFPPVPVYCGEGGKELLNYSIDTR
jgi:hypothetical protein